VSASPSDGPLIEYVGKLTRELVETLPAYCAHGKATSRHLSERWVSGDLRTRRMIARGMDRGEPRTFSLEDDLENIDLHHLSPSAGDDFVGAVLRRELRAIQSIQVVESELIVVDLSRSMMAGFFDDLLVNDGWHVRLVKPIALFSTVAALIDLGASAGFRMRVICSQGRDTWEQKGGTPGDLMTATLARMQKMLCDDHEGTLVSPMAAQPFNLVTALQSALDIRVRGVIALISDFLDPVASYGRSLMELMQRHVVVAVDVATQREQARLVPRLILGRPASQVERREGAWHLEEGIPLRTTSRREVIQWNREREADRLALGEILAHGGGVRDRIAATPSAPLDSFDDVFARSYRIALQRVSELR
jgi:hypothetical protein